ncbi:MAG TPA: aminotransferase class V-fold PLP-dependent enzyme [Bryobacterales bacterium]|nr:aminotransferase class V-fold PLP-dependent enzyme [Bryobacterales bacterium]
MKRNTTRRGWLQAGGAASAAALLSAAGATPVSETHEEPPKDVYTRLGVEPFINCTATVTTNGGSRTLPEVIKAIHAASHYHVDMDALQEAAGKRIAKLLQVEHAMVSSGAAAALAHATAGCVAGTDPERMQQLPDMTGLKNEVIMPKSSRNGYDYAVRMVGVTVIEVGTAEELKAAINSRTAMVAMLGDRFTPNVELPLKEVAPIAKRAGIPVLVDSAADYLMAPNPYIAEGADLVAYSGGKISRGPQGGGLLVGKEELVRAAFANSAHHHAFGRPMKVSKEEIIGVMTAVETFFGRRDLQQEYSEWESWYDYITKEITKVDGVSTHVAEPERGGPFPVLMVEWDQSKIGLTAGEVGDLLMNGKPAIATHAAGGGSSFRLRPVALKPKEYQMVAERLHSVFRNAPKPRPETPLKAPFGDIAGRWDVHMDFGVGEADHQLFLNADGNNVTGSHIGVIAEGRLRGTLEDDKVRLSSSLPFESVGLGYRFEGTLSGDRMSGLLNPGNLPLATWEAKRHRY